MKRLALLGCIFGISAICVSVFFSPAAQAQQNVIKLNYSNLFPANHKISIVAEEWCKEIEKRTNGEIKITIFHGSTLTPATQAYDGVVKGLSDIAMGVLSYHRGRFPLTEFADLPLGIKNCVLGSKMFNEYYNRFKPKELTDTKLMYLHANPPAILSTVKKAVSNLDDLSGAKIRVTPLGSPIVKSLGAAPVAMPMGETYDALSKNVVDGGFFPRESLEGWKLGEVVKYATESNSMGFMSAFYVVMNKGKWDSIPTKSQKIIEEVNAEWIEKTGKAWDEIDASGKEYFKKQGGEFITLSPKESERWAKAVQPVLDNYVKMTASKGLPGDEVLKFAFDYMKKNQ